MPLSDKPTQWETEVAASADVLRDAASVEVARHHLSTAVSRKPQKALWEAAKPHVAALVDDTHGAAILALVVDFGTPATVGEICEAVLPLVSTMLASEAGAKVLAALAKRVDESKGGREALFKAVVTGLSGATLVKSAPLRKAVAPLTGDAAFAKTVTTAIADKATVQWLSGVLCGKVASEEAITFVGDFLKASARLPEFSAKLTHAVVMSVKAQLAPQAEHRLRPDVFKALASYGHPETLDKLCQSAAHWSNLGLVVKKPTEAKHFAALLTRAASADDSGRRALAAAIVASCPVEELAKASFATGKLLVTLRGSGLVELPSDHLVDSVEDKITCATASCAEATRVAIQREIDRLPAGATAARRPKIAVVDSDDEAPQRPTKAARAEMAGGKAVAAAAGSGRKSR